MIQVVYHQLHQVPVIMNLSNHHLRDRCGVGCKKLERLLIVGCVGQLLVVNVIFIFEELCISSCTHWSNIHPELSIPFFLCDQYWQDNYLRILKHDVFLDFSVTNTGNLSITAFAAGRPVIFQKMIELVISKTEKS